MRGCHCAHLLQKESTHGSYMKVPSAVKWFVFQIHEVGGLVTMQKRA
jgi:hypothetical protein